ncbi:M23 family metallopeptidase [Agrobacterium sp.]|uniref:M23 family metallopeptidase n=1 Tax=Agrobacterium sp. TaxID=361 RepID=UPI0028A5890B|nr:M23 family metallopeptidase [Agrobacterium sp.]
MAHSAEHRTFGKKQKQHMLILASGDQIRHMTIRPWMTGVALCFVGLLGTAYLAATAYLIFRDDLIGATMAHQARMQHDYEDRISALRAQIDRVTSRQLLDQQVVEQKVEKLLEQQAALTSRNGRLGGLLERAEESGLGTNEASEASGDVDPKKQAGLSGGVNAIENLLGGKNKGAAAPVVAALGYAPVGESSSERADRVFSKVTLSLKSIEQDQLDRITQLTRGADRKTEEMAAIMSRTGVKIDDQQPSGIGGPFVEPQGTNGSIFESSMNDLDIALNRLETMRATAGELPFGNPAPGRNITSRFGNRMDPFLGRPALHAGIDFQAETGANVRTTGAGTVVTAANIGGYGNLVEIDHGQGITTRYGHMSAILVKAGDTVEAGDIIGRAGSTGRSTGPHVHYEVRRNDSPVDPMRFLNAGIKLQTYLN